MKILDTEGKEVGNIDLPEQFNEEIRNDLVKRAVEVIESNNRQPYGTAPRAGMRASARISKRRHDYRGCYGHGISRIPRKIMSRKGARMNWTGAIVSGTVGGSRAHPPKAAKKIKKSINVKERKMAIRSALAASLNKEMVEKRGHIVPHNYPFVINNDIQSKKQTKDVKKVLENIGLKDELLRTANRTIRAGKGKLRGRKYRTKKGPLLIVGKRCALQISAKNITGVEIVRINNINCKLLAPGKIAGRLAIYTEDSIKELKEKNLFK